MNPLRSLFKFFVVGIQKSLSKNRLLNVTNKLKFIKIIIMIKDFNHYCRKITREFVKTLIKNKEQKR
ncbi:sugar fermentation stimulation protein [Helicobacter pylori]|nr:sugar fermentation stimulation protein [Helicobacter pylori]PDW76894.1 sugar fermentation stimulation protein [Helicobacter pylori]